MTKEVKDKIYSKAEKIGMWLIALAVTGLLTWNTTMQVSSRDNQTFIQPQIDKQQCEAIKRDSIKLSLLEQGMQETSEKFSNMYSYVDVRDNAGIEIMQKIYAGVQKINMTLRLPVDFNPIGNKNTSSYQYKDTLTVNK